MKLRDFPVDALPPVKQLQLDLHSQLIVDLFAGGGGVSVAMEEAWGRSPDIAVNHSDDALSMHRVNHPQTRHFIADVFEVDPRGATQGRQVGWLHLSPDCTHFSQASGGQPRDKQIRGLAWVGKRWAGQVRPVRISLENVKQILQWCPLIAKRDPKTGRVLQRTEIYQKTKRGIKTIQTWRPAEKGEVTPVQDQYLIPNPKKLGQTWKQYEKAYKAMGYRIEYKVIRAADRGGHTTRERLIMLAFCDDQPIIWPEATHFKNHPDPEKRWRPAHECLDFSLECKSIFNRKKDLASNTMKRIAKGIVKFVLNSPEPFIVPIAHYNGRDAAQSAQEPLRTVMAATKGGEFAVVDSTLVAPSLVTATHHGADRIHDVAGSIPTVTGANRGEIMLSAPVLAKFRHDSPGSPVTAPVPTVTAGGNMARDAGAAHALGLISPVMVQAGHGEGTPGGVQRWGDGSRDVRDPIGTVMATGSSQSVAAATLVGIGGPEYAGKPASVDQPLGTLMTENHRGIACAYMMQANDGYNTTFGKEMTEPVSPVTASGSQQQLVTAHLATLRNNCDVGDLLDPVSVVAAQGQHHGLVAATMVTNTTHHTPTDLTEPAPTLLTGNHQYLASAFLKTYYTDEANRSREMTDPAATITTENRIGVVECKLSPEQEAGALRVAAFLIEFYSEGGQWNDLRDPMNTLTTRERMALVTVHIKGVPYVIVDIGLRMLTPRELFNAQDFPQSYVIDYGHDGRKFTVTDKVKMCGNSVDPKMLIDIFKANAPQLGVRKAA
jgi:DNA (cytosine-5)-methyltransferase 1